VLLFYKANMSKINKTRRIELEQFKDSLNKEQPKKEIKKNGNLVFFPNITEADLKAKEKG